MESLQFYNTCVIWTRSVILILSMLVVVLSLSIYNYNAIPVFSLLEQVEQVSYIVLEGNKLIYDMIQDRKLIATLVAAQASVFCPLFLLMSTNATSLHHIMSSSRHDRIEIWRIIIEQFCQFLIPLGLAMSWVFCITFEKKTKIALLDQNMMGLLIQDQGQYWALVAYIVDGLKYFIIIALMLEVLIIWVFSFKYATILFTSHQQVIRLLDDDVVVDSEKVLYI